MTVKLPDIEWDCRFTVLDQKNCQRILALTVKAMDTSGAYELGQAIAKKTGYVVLGSTIVPAGPKEGTQRAVALLPYKEEAKTEVKEEKKPEESPPWRYVPDPPFKTGEQIFSTKFFSKTTARPTVAYYHGGTKV